MNKTVKMQAIIMLAYLLLYVGSGTILAKLEQGTILTVLKSLLLMIFLLVSIGSPKNSNITPLKKVICGMLFVMMLQLAFIHNLQVIRIVGLNIAAFLIFALWGNERLLNIWLWGIKITAFIVSCSVAYLAYLFGDLVYLRSDAIIDKQYITIFVGLAFVTFIADFYMNKKIFLNMILFFPILIVDILIVQSKISMFVLGLSVLGWYYIERKMDVKRIVQIVIITLIAFFIVNSFVPKDSVVLDPVKQGINMMTGSELLEISRSNMKTDTYDIRAALWDYCINDLFMSNPIIGIGLGTFKDYATKGPALVHSLEETESSLLSIITEGGILYTIVVTAFFYIPICKAYRLYKKTKKYEYYIVLSFFLCYAVMIIGNDFLDSLFWVQTGIMNGVLFCKIQNKKSHYIQSADAQTNTINIL